MSEGLPPGHRVKRRGEFRRIQGRGRKVHTRHLILMVHPSLTGASHSRLGVTITKKVGKAVARNRLRRRLREAFRRNRDLFPEGSDIVVVAKRGAPEVSYAALVDELRRASKALHRAARAARSEAEPDAGARSSTAPPRHGPGSPAPPPDARERHGEPSAQDLAGSSERD